MTTQVITRKTAFIAALAALTSGCQGFGAGWGGADSGPGYETSFSCHADNDRDMWNMGAFTAPATRTLRFSDGVGALGCYHWNNPFDDGATLGLAGDSRQLPEYAYIYWSWLPKSGKGGYAALSEAKKKETGRILDNPPTYWARVPVRSQIPESVVKEVEASPMRKDHPNMPALRLHLYFIWTNEGVQMSWAEEGADTYPVLKYGGYIPQPLLPRVVENLRDWKAQYMPPPPGALPSLGVAQRMPAPSPAPTPASTPAATPAPTPPAIPKQTP